MVPAVPGTIGVAHLEIITDDYENMPQDVMLVVGSYAGDGVIGMNDFHRGRLDPADTVQYHMQWVVTFDVSGAVRDHLAAGDTCVGFSFKIDPPTSEENGGPVYLFRSLSAGPPPRLTITHTTIIEN
jgi:hypothetical protein